MRGFGRGKPVFIFAMLMGLAGLAGIPGGSGYISKTLIHESIVEYIELLEEEGLAAGPYRLAEWIFLISGGLTLAYMLKLFICLCVEKNRDAKRHEDDTFYREQVIGPRDRNDSNAIYTMADAVSRYSSNVMPSRISCNV